MHVSKTNTTVPAERFGERFEPVSTTPRQLVEMMRHAWTLGLSATPLRTDRMKLSFQETVRTVSIGRLIREGYLSPFNSYLIPNYTPAEIAAFFLAGV